MAPMVKGGASPAVVTPCADAKAIIAPLTNTASGSARAMHADPVDEENDESEVSESIESVSQPQCLSCLEVKPCVQFVHAGAFSNHVSCFFFPPLLVVAPL